MSSSVLTPPREVQAEAVSASRRSASLSAPDVEIRRRARVLIAQLHVALRTAQTHDRGNVIFTAACEDLHQAIRGLLVGQDQLHMEVVHDDLYLNRDKVKVDLSWYHSHKYVRDTFTRLGVGSLRLRGLPRREELAAAVLLLARSGTETPPGAEGLNDLLREHRVGGLVFEPPREIPREPLDLDAARDRRRRALRVYQETLDFVKHEMSSFREGQLLNVRRGKRLVQALVDVSHDPPGGFSFAGLSAIRAYHPYTFNHIVNVCLLAIAFGQRLGLDRQQLCELGLAALFHDVGKLNMPREILDKVGPLDEREWEMVRRHPLDATQQLLTLGNLTEGGMKRLLVALEHHMGFDLSGYPRFRCKRRLRLYSRIVAVVDSYDAMVSERSYDRAMLPTRALEILLQHAGTRYDPLLIKAFVNCIGLYPIGSLVELTTGELAVVVRIPDDVSAQATPGVRLARDASGRDLAGAFVDLADSTQSVRRIVSCLDPKEHQINPARYTLWVDEGDDDG